MTIRFLSREEALAIHRDQIARYGGSLGVRDEGLLESAIAMPAAQFGGHYLHAFPHEMAAAYLFHLVMNHPFIDGNKRAGLAAALVFAKLNGVKIKSTDKARWEKFVLSVASGKADKADAAVFFREHITG